MKPKFGTLEVDRIIEESIERDIDFWIEQKYGRVDSLGNESPASEFEITDESL